MLKRKLKYYRTITIKVPPYVDTNQSLCYIEIRENS